MPILGIILIFIEGLVSVCNRCMSSILLVYTTSVYIDQRFIVSDVYMLLSYPLYIIFVFNVYSINRCQCTCIMTRGIIYRKSLNPTIWCTIYVSVMCLIIVYCKLCKYTFKNYLLCIFTIRTISVISCNA